MTDAHTLPELGIIEGFYGRRWSWEARAATASWLAPHAYSFYLYAPKGDPYLRRRWREPHPPEEAAQLRAFAQHCRSLDVRFGVGLSPFEIYRNFDEATRDALMRRLAFLDDIGTQEIAILFDDMRGDVPDLAQRQIDIMHWIRERSHAQRLAMCPTYYSDDPVLDRVFGARPPRYLETIGAQLDGDVSVFWTGEEICARAISAGEVRRVGEVLRRKPFLWDNYPVNDTARMSRHLHLRAFTGRDAGVAPHVRSHGINPALQPTLSLIPALTLVDSYRLGDAYRYGAAFAAAATAVLGAELGTLVREDLLWFEDVGRDALAAERRTQLRDRYSSFDHEGAREIVAWLAGEYAVTDADVQAQ